MHIHREGYGLLWLTGTSLLLVNAILWLWGGLALAWLWVLLAASVLKFLFFLQFFRYSPLRLQARPGWVYAPAEGKIVHIHETTEPECLQARCMQLSIFMSPFNSHLNRAPIAGQVAYFRYHPGKYLVAYHPKSSTQNERTTLLLHTKTGHKVLVRQIAGLVARRIRYYAKAGDTLEAGEPFGFIKFGSRVDVFLPLDAKLLVKVGTRTFCGKTPLAALP